ncbi:MAG: hypothetical protein J6X18_17345 [Bacteroidales bacterium]|nr:hypothetical protein [Bacteroidales bacterium]MBP5725327.1 hypothetical protein [Bacteroidales bacterium]
MTEKASIPYPECTEDVIVLVCEPTTEYGRPIVYQGTTIVNALKDYYSLNTNREKVDVLKWIVAQPNFSELKRLSLVGNKIYTLYTNQYDEILKTGETPNNLQIAQKFVGNGYDVFLLANPRTTKSADFIIRKKNCLYYVEGKTSSGGSALTVRLSEGAKQADRIAVNFIGSPQINMLSAEITNIFIQRATLLRIYLFKKSRLLVINRDMALSKKFNDIFYNLWWCKK